MFFNVQYLGILCIFIKQIAVTDSWYNAELTDLGTSQSALNLSEYQFSNCSSYNIAYGSSCRCFNCSGGQCTICCNSPGFTCCYCHACLTSCWNNEWQFISIAQVGMSTALLIATIATIALFFRICSGGVRTARQTGSTNPLTGTPSARVSVSSVQQYIIERLQDRPPQYNDISDAPPVYDTDPANRVATVEAPPKYSRKPVETEVEDEPRQVPKSESSRQPDTIAATTVPSTSLPTTANHI